MTEKFSLTWNDFNENVSRTFSSMRHQEDFFDVTLVSDDQEQFSAHKVVLSACSEYFGNVLRKNKHTHPLLCLEGVSSSELNCLLDYVYNGQAQLFQEDLDRFLKIANRLQLKGLIEDPYSQEVPNSVKQEYELKRKPTIKTVEVEDPEIQEEKTESASSLDISKEYSIIMNSSDINEVNQKIEENMERTEDGGYTCKFCGKWMKRSEHIKKHVETHMEGLSFPCPTCGKIFRSRNAMQQHFYRKQC